MKRIRCPIHDYIILDDFALQLTDTKEFQRLRRIKQLGTTYLVYPGANHTRFEHSLGVYFLAKECCEQLKMSEESKKKISISALLHDIGHGPFSHLTEEVNTQHEKLTEEIIRKTIIGDVISKNGFSTEEIIEFIRGKGLGAIVSSELDVDRMDYLVRDAHYTGVSVGVDLSRLIATMKLQNNKLLIAENGLNSAESLLIARFLMYTTVYYHKTARIAQKMLVKAIERTIEEKQLTKNHFQKMDDYELIHFLKNTDGFSKEIAERVENRNLFKLCFELKYDKLSNEKKEMLNEKEEIIKLEKEITEKLNVEDGKVIIDIPKKPIIEEINTNILLFNGKIEKIINVSKLVSILEMAEMDYLKLRVYTTKEKRERGRLLAEKIFL